MWSEVPGRKKKIVNMRTMLMAAAMGRRWLRCRVSVSRVTLEDESAPGVSSSSALPYAKC